MNKQEMKNLTKGEKISMKQLIEDELISILAADKGRAKVVINKEGCIQKATELLEDQECYKKLNKTPS